MKLQFKEQGFQLEAVRAIVDIFQGQPKRTGLQYMMDPGRAKNDMDISLDAFKNAPIELSLDRIREKVREIQVTNHLKPSDKLSTA